MIGNDLVYLPTWPKREGSRLQRFRTKVFTEAEREFITSTENPHLAEAWLWSCKEAAYKVWFKSNHKREFAPKKFKVETQAPLSLDADRSVSIKTQASLGLDADRSASIKSGDVCQAESPCRPQCLHLNLGHGATLEAFGRQYFLYSVLEKDYIHTLASDHSFAEMQNTEIWRGHIRPKRLYYNGKGWHIEKDQWNIPFGKSQGQKLDLSISHDGPAAYIVIKKRTGR